MPRSRGSAPARASGSTISVSIRRSCRRSRWGGAGITTTQLEKIAGALQIDPVALRAGEIQAKLQPSVFLRHRGARQDFAMADAPVLDAALDHARSRNVLAGLVGQALGVLPLRKVETRGVANDAANAPARQGYQLARELRRMIGNEADAIADLREFAESVCGVTVLVRRLATIGPAWSRSARRPSLGSRMTYLLRHAGRVVFLAGTKGG